MKIAICYSGHGDRLEPNHFNQQLSMYKNYTHIDLFFSLWNGNNAAIENSIRQIVSDKLSGSHQLYFEWKDEITECPLTHTQCDEICQHYQPIRWYSQYTGIKNADLLRQRYSNDYDMVIRSRLDIGLEGNVDFELWNERLKTIDVIYPRSWNWYMFWTETRKMINDQFFIARPETMSRLVNLVDRMDEYIDAGCRFHGESLMWWNTHYGCSARYELCTFDTVLRGVIETR